MPTEQTCENHRQTMRNEYMGRFEGIYAKIESVEDKLVVSLNNKVDKSTFWTVFTVMLGVLSSLLGLVYVEVKAIGLDVQITKQDMATVKGKLEPYDITIQK